MTRSNPRSQEAALSAAFSRAVDLSALKRSPEPPRAAPAAPSGDGAPAAGRPAHIVDVTEATFSAEVIERSMQVLVIVDLWAEWCQPCKQLTPALERVTAGYGGAVVLAKVDVDANPRISQAFGVQSIPTVVAIAGGQPVDAFAGAQPEPQIRAWISGLVEALKSRLPGLTAAGAVEEAEPEPDPLRLAAERALDEGDLAGAIAAYEQLVQADPTDSEAALALGQLRFQERAADLPADSVARAQAAPDDVAAQTAGADVLFATGEVEQAFELLVRAVARSAGDDRDAARDHLLELFALLGHDDPRVMAARRKLAAALY